MVMNDSGESTEEGLPTFLSVITIILHHSPSHICLPGRSMHTINVIEVYYCLPTVDHKVDHMTLDPYTGAVFGSESYYHTGGSNYVLKM
jgi:hypothetical protein